MAKMSAYGNEKVCEVKYLSPALCPTCFRAGTPNVDAGVGHVCAEHGPFQATHRDIVTFAIRTDRKVLCRYGTGNTWKIVGTLKADREMSAEVLRRIATKKGYVDEYVRKR